MDSVRKSESRVWAAIAKRRYLKKFLSALMPSIGAIWVKSDLKIFVDLKDWSGPSFYLMQKPYRNFISYEFEQKTFLLEHFPQNGVFLDAGANIGLYSFFIKLKRPDSTVISFEPHPLLAECLRQSRLGNPKQDIQIFELGLGRTEEQLKLYCHPDNSGGHSAVEGTFLGQNKNQSRNIQICTLDRFVEENQIKRIDFIKIDVQDMEEQVILGGQKTINRLTPNFLIEMSNLRIFSDQNYLNIFSEFLLNNNTPSTRYQWCTANIAKRFYSAEDLKDFAKKEYEANRLYTDYFFLRNLESDKFI